MFWEPQGGVTGADSAGATWGSGGFFGGKPGKDSWLRAEEREGHSATICRPVGLFSWQCFFY